MFEVDLEITWTQWLQQFLERGYTKFGNGFGSSFASIGLASLEPTLGTMSIVSKSV